MKIRILLLIVFGVFANICASAQNITYSGTNVSLKTIFAVIKKQSGYAVFGNSKILKNAKTVTVSVKNASPSELLTQALKDQDLDFVIEDKTIIIVQKQAPLKKDLVIAKTNSVVSNEITGRVTDADGKPLSGANIKVKGTSIGTATDNNGNFSITVQNQSAVLEISYVGYTTKTITASQNFLQIILDPAENTVQEVVVTALGISKDARKLGYSTTKLGGDILNQARETNIAYSLEGRVAGLNVSGANGGPGSSANILIRGISNFTSATGPLFVIDGVPMDNSQKGTAGLYGGSDQGDGISSINPDDIDNIVVLKGSTASALYGVRAANGVIQITTKSGKGQRGFGVEINSNTSFNSIINNTDYQKVYGHGINGQRPLSMDNLITADIFSWGEKFDGKPSINADGEMHPYKAVINPANKFYRTGLISTNTVSVVNGGENGNMRFSFSYLDNQSVIPNSGLKRYTANLNINQNILQKLKFTLVANYIDEAAKLRSFLNDKSRNPNFTMNLLPANIDPNYLKPGYNTLTGYENAMSSDGYTPNPWFIVEKTVNNTNRKRLITSTSLRYDILKGLYIQGRTGLDFVNDDVLNIEPTGIGFKRDGGLNAQTKGQITELNMDVMAGYSTSLVKNITMDATVGGSVRKYKTETEGFSGNQWKQPFLYTISNLFQLNPIYAFSQLQTNSGYYTADFSYKNFVTLSTTGRYDVFSTLPQGNRSIFTPSVSGSLIFSNLVKIPKLNYGKLRASYAETSGEAAPYQTSVYYEIQPQTNGGLPYGNTLSSVANLNLKPYTLKEFEVGMELRWFKSRLGADISYFHRRTNKEIINKQITIASGYNSSYQALGATQNQGVELALNGTPIKTSSFAWNISFNLTTISNKLISLDGTENPAPIQTGQYRPSVGPYNNGAFVAGVQGLPLSQIMVYDYKYDDRGNIIIGENGIPSRGNLVAKGSGLPKGYGGLNNEFTYKRFNLSFLIDYKYGNKVLSGTDFFSYYFGLNKETLNGRESGVVAVGVNAEGKPNTKVVPAQAYYQGLVTNVSAMSVFDGGFIKFRQVALGYSFTPASLKRTVFQAINVSLVARNLFTILKHIPNADPEDSFSSLPGYAGLEGIGIPQTRTYGINLNFKFKK